MARRAGRVLRRFQQGDERCGAGHGRCEAQGAGRPQRRILRGLRTADGREEGQVRIFPRLPGLPGVHVHKADRNRNARQMPEVRRQDTQAHLEKGLCVLRLRARPRVRIYHMGRADEGLLPGLRQDDVQAQRPRRAQALLHKRGLPELRA